MTRALRSLSQPHNGLLLVILVFALVLRCQNILAIQHNVDHAYPIWQALTTLDRGTLPLLGQDTSVLIPNPALTGYLFVPWMALTRSPLGAYLFVIALNTLAVWLLYRTALQIASRAEALLAAFLMAANPWVVEYSRATWVQALIPFFACLVFWLLLPIIRGTAVRPARRTLWLFIAITAMTQTYLLAFVAVIPVGALLLIYRRHVPWRAVAAGGAIFVVATGLYLAALISDRAWETARLTDGKAAHLTGEAWSHALRLVTGENYAAARGLDAPVNDWRLRENISQAVHWALLIAVVAGLISAVYGLWRSRRSQSAPARARWLLTLIWFAAPILLMSYVSKPVHPFYLLLTLPAGYILAAWGVGYVLRYAVGRWAVLAFAVAIGMLFGLNVLRFSEDTLAHPGINGPGVLPVGNGMDVVRALLPPESRQPGAVVFADVDEWFLNSLSGSLFPVDRDLNTPQVTYVPQGGATYLLFTKDPVGQFIAPTGAGSQGMSFILSDQSRFVRYVLRPADLTLPALQPVTSDLGLTYLGTVLEQSLQPGATVTVRTFWRVDDLAPERGIWLFGPFVHVYDSTQKRVAIGTGAVVPGIRWRPGDLQIQRITVAMPPDAIPPFTLQIGQYDGTHNVNGQFSLPAGVQSVTIPFIP